MTRSVDFFKDLEEASAQFNSSLCLSVAPFGDRQALQAVRGFRVFFSEDIGSDLECSLKGGTGSGEVGDIPYNTPQEMQSASRFEVLGAVCFFHDGHGSFEVDPALFWLALHFVNPAEL